MTGLRHDDEQDDDRSHRRARPVSHVCTGTSGSEILDGTPARPGHGS